MRERAYGLEYLARRSHRAADINGTARRIGFGAGIPGGGHVDLAHPLLSIMKLEPVAAAAKGVGENNVGAGRDETAMERAHAVRMLEIPQLRRIAGDQPHLEIIGSGGTVGEEPWAAGEGISKARCGHLRILEIGAL